MESKQTVEMKLISSEVPSTYEEGSDMRSVRFRKSEDAGSKPKSPLQTSSLHGFKVKKSRPKPKSKSNTTIGPEILAKQAESVLDIYDPHLYAPVTQAEIEEYKNLGELRRLQYCKYRNKTLEIAKPIIAKSDDNLSPRKLGSKYRDVFGHIKCVMIDLSGTLYTGNDVITQYADQAVARLRSLGLKLLFVNNASNESSKMLLKRLRGLGFDLSDKELYTSVKACNNFLVSNKYRPFYLVDEAILEDFSAQLSQDRPTVVVIGSKPLDVGYGKLTKTIAMLEDGAGLIGIQKLRQYETENGQEMGAGPFIESLEFTTGKKATIIGKPDQYFFNQALAFSEWKVEDTVMIGDDVFEDVIGAKNAGLKSILVKTGKYKQNDELKISPAAPDYISRNFAYAVRCIEAAISVKQGIPIDSSYLDPAKLQPIRIDYSNRDFLDKMNTYMNPCVFDQPCPDTSTMNLLLSSENPARISLSQFSTLSGQEPRREMYIDRFIDGQIVKTYVRPKSEKPSQKQGLKNVESSRLVL